MQYSIERLTTVDDCDAAIAQAQQVKDSLDFKKANLEHRQLTQEARADRLESTNSGLTALQNIYANLPAGEVKDDVERRIEKLEYRKFTMEKGITDHGVLALLDHETDVGRMEAEIAELEAFIDAVNTHKATL